MSEYQYYEFLAVDRPLTSVEMRELRGVSSRAEITPTSFTNTYNWGDLKADPLKLLERYFDVFVYVANWGTYRVAFRLPEGALDLASVEGYLSEELASVKRVGEHVILDICLDEEDRDFEEGSGWMASLAPVRAELLSGDLRSLYLLWLASLNRRGEEDLDPEEAEPPVPEGLAAPSAGQMALAEFLDLEESLIGVAAEGSAPATGSRDGLVRFVAALPADEKDRLLLSVVEGQEVQVKAGLLRRYRAAAGTRSGGSSAKRRTVGELLEAAGRRNEELEREEERLAEEERRRKEALAEAAKKKRVELLVGKEDAAWRNAERLVASKKSAAYDEAVELLGDLKTLSGQTGNSAFFETRLRSLVEAHRAKRAFIAQLSQAGLWRPR